VLWVIARGVPSFERHNNGVGSQNCGRPGPPFVPLKMLQRDIDVALGRSRICHIEANEWRNCALEQNVQVGTQVFASGLWGEFEKSQQKDIDNLNPSTSSTFREFPDVALRRAEEGIWFPAHNKF